MSAAALLKHRSSYFLTEKSVIYDRVRTYLRNRCWARKIFENYPDACETVLASNTSSRTTLRLTRKHRAVDFQTAWQVLKEEKAKQRIRYGKQQKGWR